MESLQGHGFEGKRLALDQLLFWKLSESGSFWSRADTLLISGGVLMAIVASGVRTWRHRLWSVDRGLVLVLAMTFATAVSALVIGLLGTQLFGSRNLAVSWVGIPLLIGWLCVRAGRIFGTFATLLILGGLLVGSINLTDGKQSDFKYRDAAELIEREYRRGDSVVDLSHITPVNLTPLGAYLDGSIPDYPVNQPTSDPPFIPGNTEVPDPQAVLDKAFSESRRVQFVTLVGQDQLKRDGTVPVGGRSIEVPAGWQIVRQRTFDGIYPLTVTTFEQVPRSGS